MNINVKCLMEVKLSLPYEDSNLCNNHISFITNECCPYCRPT